MIKVYDNYGQVVGYIQPSTYTIKEDGEIIVYYDR